MNIGGPDADRGDSAGGVGETVDDAVGRGVGRGVDADTRVGRNGVHFAKSSDPGAAPASERSAPASAAASAPGPPPGRSRSLSRRPAQQWPLLVVLAGVAIGLAFCFGEQWRLGCVIVGASLGVGAIERIALPRRDAGLLQVRGRAFDITMMLGLGVVIVTLAIVVPGPHR